MPSNSSNPVVSPPPGLVFNPAPLALLSPPSEPPGGNVVAPVSPPTNACFGPGNGVILFGPFLQPVVAMVATSASTSGKTNVFIFIFSIIVKNLRLKLCDDLENHFAQAGWELL